MAPIFWIDKNKFSSDFIEKTFKKKNIPFYSLKEARNFAYLVDDLLPLAIVIDASTVQDTLAEFRSEFENSPRMQSTPFIFINEIPELDFVAPLGVLRKPLDPFKVPDAVLSLINGKSSQQ